MMITFTSERESRVYLLRYKNKKSTCLPRTIKSGGWEGTDRTQFLWRKPSETEAHLHVAPLLGTSMSWLPNPAPCYKVSSQSQGLSVVRYPPSPTSHGVTKRLRGSWNSKINNCLLDCLNNRTFWGRIFNREFLFLLQGWVLNIMIKLALTIM